MTTHPTPPASPSPAEAVEVRKRRETRMVMRLPRMTPHMPQSDAVERAKLTPGVGKGTQPLTPKPQPKK